MAPWAKSNSAASTMMERGKHGMLWAHHKYRQGLHLALKAADMYQTGKHIAGIFMPELHAMGAAKPLMQGFGAVDNVMHKGIQTHADVLNKIGENSAILGKLRQARTLAQPYMS